MAGLFNTVVVKVPRRNSFSRSYENHLTTDFGKLTPILCEEVYPGDKFRFRTEMVVKLAEMIAPAMARIDAYVHYFFVPNRLLYTDWEKFITGGTDGTFSNGTELSPVAPWADINDLANGGWLDQGKLGDYLGLPSLAHGQSQVYYDVPPISMLPFFAYQKVFSDYYRDELLSTFQEWQPQAGGKVTSLSYPCSLRYRAWKKDYFTSSRPDTQLGPAQSVPVSGSIMANGPFMVGINDAPTANANVGVIASQIEDRGSDFDPRYETPLYVGQMNSDNRKASYLEGLSLEDAGILINDLRRTLRLQEWSEKNMRGGNRYIENIFHHFGVKSSDARLQRAQYLGGRKVPVLISEVLQQTGTVGDAQYSSGARYLGSRGGVGNAVGSSQTLSYFSEEHGFILGILSIMPHASYMQGIPRMFGDRWDRFSYMWPEFGNLGEQEVYNWELFVAAGQNQKNNGIFGYQSRYADLKQHPSELHGEFRTNLQYWHTGRIFSLRPLLNESFVTLGQSSDTADGMNRIFAVNQNSLSSHFRCHLFNKVSVLRMLPKFGIPSL